MWYKSKYLYGKKKRKKRKKLTSRLKILFVRIDLLPSNRYRSTTVVRIWIPRTEEPFRNKKKKTLENVARQWSLRCCRTTSVGQRISIQLRFSSFRVFLRNPVAFLCKSYSFATDFPLFRVVFTGCKEAAAWPIGGDSSRNRIERACSVSVTILEARYSNVKKEAWVGWSAFEFHARAIRKKKLALCFLNFRPRANQSSFWN